MECSFERDHDVFSYFQEKEGELEHQKKLNELELQKAKELAEIEVWNQYSVSNSNSNSVLGDLFIIFFSV